MYEVQLVGNERPVRVDADRLYIYADSGTTSHIVLTKNKTTETTSETVFFAPFDSIISVLRREHTETQSGTFM